MEDGLPPLGLSRPIFVGPHTKAVSFDRNAPPRRQDEYLYTKPWIMKSFAIRMVESLIQ